MGKKVIKWCVVLVGLIQIAVLFLPYVKSFNAIKSVQICYDTLGNSWGTEYLIEFIVPVGLSVFAALIFLIKANIGTDIFGLIFNGIAARIYVFGIDFFSKREIDTSVGLSINRILLVVELVLYVLFIVFSILNRKKEQ